MIDPTNMLAEIKLLEDRLSQSNKKLVVAIEALEKISNHFSGYGHDDAARDALDAIRRIEK